MSESGLSSADDEEPRDWRQQLYYWRGMISVEKKRLKWTGTWVGSFDGKPSDSDFETSVQSFIVTGPKLSKGADSLSIDDVKGKYTGTYLMDNDGSGKLGKYKTSAQMKYVAHPAAAGDFLVCGKGSNEFGHFVINGIFQQQGMLLDNVREYIADEDERVSKSLDDLLRDLIAQKDEEKQEHDDSDDQNNTSNTAKRRKIDTSDSAT